MSNWKKLEFLTNPSKLPQSSLEFSFLDFVEPKSKFTLTGSRYYALKHSEHINKIEEFINRNKSNGFCLEQIEFPSSIKKNAFYSQLKIFLLKLKMFKNIQEKYNLKSKYDLGEILLGTLREGFQFNSDYKKKIDSDTRDYLRGDTQYVYQDFPDYHLIPWLDEDPIGEIYVFKDPIPVNEKSMKRVADVMDRHILPDAFIRDIDLLDALYLINNKKVNQLDEKGRTMTSFDARGDQLNIEFPDYELDYLFKKVTTDPCTSRAAGLSTVETRNLVYSAHSNLDLITEHENDLYKEGLDPDMWKQKLSATEDRYYIMIDFKKSGLTTNREVIKEVYKAALRKYPKFRPFERYLTCLENVRVNGSLSKRGTSLGMDDNAISFFLSCAFEDWKERNPIYNDKVFGYFKGDDQVLICDCDEEMTKEIFISWLKTLRKLGFLVNAKKSFIGIKGQFCEIVGQGKGLDDKIIGFSMNSLDALGCYNQVDFKLYLRNLKRFKDGGRYAKIFDYFVSTAIFATNREFCNDELEVPFEMGGFFSNYENGLNTFITDVYKNKYNCDRRLYNVIGVDLPEQCWEFKRRKDLFQSMFDDTKALLRKLKIHSSKPMSRKWKESYDRCASERARMFNGTIEIIGSRVQKLIDFNDKFALSPDLLILNKRKDKIFVPRVKRRRGKIADFETISKRKISIVSKKYYTIDAIRARELLLSVNGSNKFLINYYNKLPISTIIWSLAKNVLNSKYAIPIKWLEYMLETRVSLDKLWNYYSQRGINLYDYEPRTLYENKVSELFRGPEDADCVIFEPETGLPIKFNSYDFFVWIENKKNPKTFFLDIVGRYCYVWLDERHQEAWWGPGERNKHKESVSRAQMIPLQVMSKDIIEDKILELKIEGVSAKSTAPTHIIFADSDEEEQGSLSNHDSDSDYLEEYFRDNPLNDDEDEENVYANLSTDSESEE